MPNLQTSAVIYKFMTILIKEKFDKQCLFLVLSIAIACLLMTSLVFPIYGIKYFTEFIYNPETILKIMGLAIIFVIIFLTALIPIFYSLFLIYKFLFPAYIELSERGIKASGIKNFIKWSDIKNIYYFDIKHFRTLIFVIPLLQLFFSTSLWLLVKIIQLNLMLRAGNPLENKMSIIIQDNCNKYYILTIDPGLTEYSDVGLIETINLYKENGIIKKDSIKKQKTDFIQITIGVLFLIIICFMLVQTIVIDIIRN